MFAVVLVGGFGTRLRPLTNHVPKPMLPVVHRPMIVDLVDRLAQGGVTDVVLALGFKPEPFQAAFPGGRHGEVRVHYAVEPAPLDTAGAIAFAARAVAVDDTFVVANGDIITDLPIADLVAAHRRLGAQATLHLTPVDDPSAFGVVEVDDGGRVRRFVEKPQPGQTDSNLINAGTYVFEPSVLDHVEPDQRLSVERVVFPLLAESHGLFGISTDHYWLDTGRPDQYLQANLDLVRGVRGAPIDGVHASARVDPSATVVDSVIGPGAEIGAGACVTGSALLAGAFVAASAMVESSIVAGRIGASAQVTNCVIGVEHDVAAGERIVDARLPSPE
ncbi:MAG: NDP-sugar synthase [Ilumatobacteraceae bacterium]